MVIRMWFRKMVVDLVALWVLTLPRIRQRAVHPKRGDALEVAAGSGRRTSEWALVSKG